MLLLLPFWTYASVDARACCIADPAREERQAAAPIVLTGTVLRLDTVGAGLFPSVIAEVRVDRVWKGRVRGETVLVDLEYGGVMPGDGVYAIVDAGQDGVLHGGGRCTDDVGALSAAPDLPAIASARPETAGVAPRVRWGCAPPGRTRTSGRCRHGWPGAASWPTPDGLSAWVRPPDAQLPDGLLPARHLGEPIAGLAPVGETPHPDAVYLVELGDFEVLDWLRPDQLAQSTSHAIPVAPGAGLRWAAGVPVGADGRVNVPGVTSEWAVAELDRGVLWSPTAWREGEGTPLAFEGSLVLFDRPGGRALATVTNPNNDVPVWLSATAPPHDGWRAVHVSGSIVFGSAFVDANVVTETTGFAFSVRVGGGVTSPCGMPPKIVLDEGALVRDADGAVFARARGFATPVLLARGPTAVWIRVQTLHGWRAGVVSCAFVDADGRACHRSPPGTD